MTRFVVDTNVPIVANGRYQSTESKPSIACRLSAIEFLERLLDTGHLVLDLDGEIQSEYRRYLNPQGQPGVGDRFYLEVLNSSPELIERVDLPKSGDGEYAHFPKALVALHFDPSDRKFAALSNKEQIPMVNATDTDWLHHIADLIANGIQVKFVCGNDPNEWFEEE